MIVEVDENEQLQIPDSYIWVTLFQIKQTVDLHPYDKDHAMVIATSLG